MSGVWLLGQNLIGYNYKEIRKYMNENHKEMNYNNVTNSKYRYLKYTDNSDRQTLFFFLNQDSVCQSIRLICDSYIKTDKVKEYNSIYQKSGENIWKDSRNGKDFVIEIEDEKWSSVITIKPVK
jgi:hypothetical protein